MWRCGDGRAAQRPRGGRSTPRPGEPRGKPPKPRREEAAQERAASRADPKASRALTKRANETDGAAANSSPPSTGSRRASSHDDSEPGGLTAMVTGKARPNAKQSPERQSLISRRAASPNRPGAGQRTLVAARSARTRVRTATRTWAARHCPPGAKPGPTSCDAHAEASPDCLAPRTSRRGAPVVCKSNAPRGTAGKAAYRGNAPATSLRLVEATKARSPMVSRRAAWPRPRSPTARRNEARPGAASTSHPPRRHAPARRNATKRQPPGADSTLRRRGDESKHEERA